MLGAPPPARPISMLCFIEPMIAGICSSEKPLANRSFSASMNSCWRAVR